MRAPENLVQIFNTRWRISPEERGKYSCNKSWELFVSLAEAKIIYQMILKVVGNEKNGGPGRSQMLRYGAGPWPSMFVYNLNMQF